MAQFIKTFETTQLAVTENNANQWLTANPNVNVISITSVTADDRPVGIHWGIIILYEC